MRWLLWSYRDWQAHFARRREARKRYWTCIVRGCEKPSEPRSEIGKTSPGAPFCADHNWSHVPGGD